MSSSRAGNSFETNFWSSDHQDVSVIVPGATAAIAGVLDVLRAAGVCVRRHLCDDPATPERLLRERPRLVLVAVRGDHDPSMNVVVRLAESLRSLGAAVIGVIDEVDPPSAVLAELTDFVRPPYSIEELALRVRVAGVRGRSRPQPAVLVAGDLHLDAEAFAACCRGVRLSLSYKEFELLRLLMQVPDRVVSRETLLTCLWPVDRELNPRAVDTHVSRLRRKLRAVGATNLVTVRRRGFLLRTAPGAAEASPRAEVRSL